jgi:hypothetical protein
MMGAHLMTYGLGIHIVPYARREFTDAGYVETCDGKTTACGQAVDTLYGGWRAVHAGDYGEMECRECHIAYYHGDSDD